MANKEDPGQKEQSGFSLHCLLRSTCPKMSDRSLQVPSLREAAYYMYMGHVKRKCVFGFSVVSNIT